MCGFVQRCADLCITVHLAPRTYKKRELNLSSQSYKSPLSLCHYCKALNFVSRVSFAFINVSTSGARIFPCSLNCMLS